MTKKMDSVLKSVDERSNLVGSNRLEVLLFSLGRDKTTGRSDVFGINVFKVREVIKMPIITKAPNLPTSVEGMVSLRNTTIPVINLPKFCNIETDDEPGILIVTEYNNHVQGFMVNNVENIERLSWEDLKTPPDMISNRDSGLVTAVADLPKQGIIMIMDVEKVLSEVDGIYQNETVFRDLSERTWGPKEMLILYADDSSVARNQIETALTKLKIKTICCQNGQEAWKKLNEMAAAAEMDGIRLHDRIHIILTDVEMPEMDGYVLTQKIKADPRMRDIPVVMHSSLSAEANQSLAKKVNVDAYVPKFEPKALSDTLQSIMEKDGQSAN